MKHIMKATMLMLLFIVLPTLANADVFTGKAIDEKTGEPIAMASVKVEVGKGEATYSSSTTTDSLGLFAIQTYSTGRLTLTVSSIGYHEAKKRSYSSGISTDTIRLGEFKLKPTDFLLNEITVSAKAKRFTMRGDTIVFNPAAFKLAEGARIKELIEKLPGVTEKQGKLYWNDKPLRLQMNGRDIFGGSGLVTELPAEAVQNIQTYNKASELAQHSGKDDGKEDQVLDIKIKKSFMDKWYGDIKVAYQTPKNYQAGLKTSKLSDNNPFLIALDANNINQAQTVTTRMWRSGQFDNFGKAQSAALGYQHNWKVADKNKNYLTVAHNFNHKDGWGTDYASTQYFAPDNVSTWTLSRNSHQKHEIAPEIETNLFSYTDAKNFVKAGLTFSYNLERNHQTNDRATFDTDTKPFGNFPLDIALAAQRGEALYTHCINRERTYQQNITEGGKIDFNGSWNHFLGKKGQLTIGTAVGYTKGNNRFSAHRELEHISQGIASPLYQYSRSPYHGLDISGYGEIEYNLSDALYIEASQILANNSATTNQQFYTADRADAIDNNPANTLDAANSYRQKQHATTATSKIGLTYKVGNWQFLPNIAFAAKREKLDYERGKLDTIAHRNSTLWTPAMQIKWKINQQNRLEYNFQYDTSLPQMLSTLGYRDETDPLYIIEGNPFLHSSHTHQSSLTYSRTMQKQQSMLMFKVGYAHTINPIASVFYYNPQTGVYRKRDENMRSGNNWYLENTYDKSFGDYFNFSNTIEAHIIKSYGYLTALNERADRTQNEMKRLTLGINPELAFEKDWLQITLFGDWKLHRNKYSLSPEYNNKPLEYSVGLRTSMKWERIYINSSIESKATRGYLASELNRHRWLWNVYAIYNLKKNKGYIGIFCDDLLNQDREYAVDINAMRRSETWSDRIHHYVRLIFNYHFDAKGKKEK